MKEIIVGNEDLELPDTVRKIAKHELREDCNNRKQCIEELRNWLSKNEDIINMRIDDGFLLRFLRFNKFNVAMAKQTILKYLNIRRTFPHLSTCLDILDNKLNEIISSGYIVVTPQRDRNGRRMIIMKAKYFNAKLFGSEEQAKVHFLTYECLMEDPITQIVGVIHIIDMTGVTAQHILNWNPIEFARIFKWGEQSLPMRHKEIHLINAPSKLKWLIDFTKSRVSPKLRNRLIIYTNERDLCKSIDISCLPQELGGPKPLKYMIDLWKQELLQKRNITLNLDHMKLLSDRGIIRKSSYNSDKTNTTTIDFTKQIDYIEGSFRQLEFD